MSGAELPITTAPSKDTPNVFIGSAAPAGAVDVSANTLGFDGYVIKTAGGDLILAGAKPYSSV